MRKPDRKIQELMDTAEPKGPYIVRLPAPAPHVHFGTAYSKVDIHKLPNERYYVKVTEESMSTTHSAGITLTLEDLDALVDLASTL